MQLNAHANKFHGGQTGVCPAAGAQAYTRRDQVLAGVSNIAAGHAQNSGQPPASLFAAPTSPAQPQQPDVLNPAVRSTIPRFVGLMYDSCVL